MVGLSRRTFLGAAAASQAGARRIRIAFLGAAHGHANPKILLVKNSPDWELAGIVEDDAKIRAQYEQAGIAALSREQVLTDASIEVVAVESQVERHARDAFAALNAGKHVHVEKPPADNMAEMRTIVEAARRKERLMQTGYMWRQHPGFARILEAVRQGWLGDVFLVRGTINTRLTAEERAGVARFRGGLMFELGCHLLDPVVRMLGMPRRVTPHLRQHGAYQDKLRDNTVAVLEYAKAMAVVSSSGIQPHAMPQRSFEVFGANGSAVLRPIEPAALELDLEKAAGPYAQGRQNVALPAYRRYEGDFAELARAVRESKPLSVTLDEEVRVQQVLLEASEMSEFYKE